MSVVIAKPIIKAEVKKATSKDKSTAKKEK